MSEHKVICHSKNSVFSNFISIIGNDGCERTRVHRVYFKVISEHDEASRSLRARGKIGGGKSTRRHDLWRASRRSGGDIHRIVLKNIRSSTLTQVDEGKNEQRGAINETWGTLRGCTFDFYQRECRLCRWCSHPKQFQKRNSEEIPKRNMQSGERLLFIKDYHQVKDYLLSELIKFQN